jgi:hypothetical protein
MSGKVSAGVSEVVSAGVCESGFKPVHFAQPANARQPSNIRAVRGIFMFSSQVPDVPELIFYHSRHQPSKNSTPAPLVKLKNILKLPLRFALYAAFLNSPLIFSKRKLWLWLAISAYPPLPHSKPKKGT